MEFNISLRMSKTGLHPSLTIRQARIKQTDYIHVPGKSTVKPTMHVPVTPPT